jgi:hypothetical protein
MAGQRLTLVYTAAVAAAAAPAAAGDAAAAASCGEQVCLVHLLRPVQLLLQL